MLHYFPVCGWMKEIHHHLLTTLVRFCTTSTPPKNRNGGFNFTQQEHGTHTRRSETHILSCSAVLCQLPGSARHCAGPGSATLRASSPGPSESLFLQMQKTLDWSISISFSCLFVCFGHHCKMPVDKRRSEIEGCIGTWLFWSYFFTSFSLRSGWKQLKCLRKSHVWTAKSKETDTEHPHNCSLHTDCGVKSFQMFEFLFSFWVHRFFVFFTLHVTVHNVPATAASATTAHCKNNTTDFKPRFVFFVDRISNLKY